MQVFLNRSQLCRRLGCAAETLRRQIQLGAIRADARDGRNQDLFSEKIVKAACLIAPSYGAKPRKARKS